MKTRIIKKQERKYKRLTKLFIRKQKQSGKSIKKTKLYLKLYALASIKSLEMKGLI